jgi:hypothetical protein
MPSRPCRESHDIPNGKDCLVNIEQSEVAAAPNEASLYRTRWLMAHNHLHRLVHEGGDPQVIFEDYLRALGTSEDVASRDA